MINLTLLFLSRRRIGSNEWMMMIIFRRFGIDKKLSGAFMAGDLLTALIIIVMKPAIATSGYGHYKEVGRRRR
jgi:hypothetical protein